MHDSAARARAPRSLRCPLRRCDTIVAAPSFFIAVKGRWRRCRHWGHRSVLHRAANL